MRSLLLKVITIPIVLFAADWMLAGIDFANFGQILLVGIILAIVGTMMEYVLLREGTLWISTLADLVATVLILYFVSNAFAGAEVNFWGTVAASLIITLIEIPVHLWLIRSGYAKKSPAY